MSTKAPAKSFVVIPWGRVSPFKPIWANIRVSLTGGEDTATCAVCGAVANLRDTAEPPLRRERDQILLAFAEGHYESCFPATAPVPAKAPAARRAAKK